MNVERHSDYFDPDVDDDVWLRNVSERSWVTITADKNIEKDHLEAVCDSRARVIILTDNRSGYAQWAAAIIAGQDSFLKTLALSAGPLIIRLSRHGVVTKVRETEEVDNRRVKLQTARIVRAKQRRQ